MVTIYIHGRPFEVILLADDRLMLAGVWIFPDWESLYYYTSPREENNEPFLPA